jgi:hypothetical protein
MSGHLSAAFAAQSNVNIRDSLFVENKFSTGFHSFNHGRERSEDESSANTASQNIRRVPQVRTYWTNTEKSARRKAYFFGVAERGVQIAKALCTRTAQACHAKPQPTKNLHIRDCAKTKADCMSSSFDGPNVPVFEDDVFELIDKPAAGNMQLCPFKDALPASCN